jgi:UDPglucose--hexose-1-phosphate uridylyltransferase
MLDLRQHPHRRFNPLRNEWVIVSPDRNKRPWQGTVEASAAEPQATHDPTCYLCPGNERAGGIRNPEYTSTFAFDNDFPALRLAQPEPFDSPLSPSSKDERLAQDKRAEGRARSGQALVPTTPASASAYHDLLVAQSERGICRVLCFSPRHDLTLARMDPVAIRTVVDAWIGEYAALAGVPWLAYATIFENRGAVMGASNPHPHCQIWATEHIPNEPSLELDALTAHHARQGSCLLCDYAALELAAGERIVCANDGFVALVPFWAAWPFETLVVSRRHVSVLTSLRDEERDALADILKQLTTRYDNVFETPFPYSMGFHQQPVRGGSPETAHLHAHFYPPLVRSATIRKFMVGFELLGSPQRDVTPEDAAARLREVPSVHYADRSEARVSPAPSGVDGPVPSGVEGT